MEQSPAKQILICHRDARTQQLFASCLCQDGYECKVAGHGAEVLKLLETYTPDVIVTELVIPELDAFQLCRLVKSEYFPAANQVPVLIVSSDFPPPLGEIIAHSVGAYAILPMEAGQDRFRSTIRLILAPESLTADDRQLLDPRLRVLIVDDDPDIRRILSVMLQQAGYVTETSASGAEAVQKSPDFKPQVVFLDHEMPGMTGIEAIDYLLAIDPEMIIIMLTGHGNPSLAIEAIRRGVIDYLTKEHIPASLQRTIDAAVTRQKLRQILHRHEQIGSRLSESQPLG